MSTVLQAKLSTDEVVLGTLGPLERCLTPFPPGAGISHRRPEDYAIKLVAYVVVVPDRSRVTPLRVKPSGKVDLNVGRFWRRADNPQAESGTKPGGYSFRPNEAAGTQALLERPEDHVHITLDIELARDESSRQAQFVR